MSGALGEYFSDAELSLGPGGGHFADEPAAAAPPPPRPAPPRTAGGMGEYFSQSGMGATVYPAHQGAGKASFLRRISPIAGAVGDAGDAVTDVRQGVTSAVGATTSLAWTLVKIAAVFGSGWVIGKEIAPKQSSETAYKWGTALAATFTGVLGIGAAGLIAMQQKK